MQILNAPKSVTKRIAASSQKEEGNLNVQLSAKDYLFTQNTIVCSVLLEPNSHFIRSSTSKYVNANGETWSNESLKANYQSFIGSWNYVNHIQVPAKSIGFIADAVLRKIPLENDPGQFINYVDILVATHRSNELMCKKIATGDVEYLSMGCDVYKSMCSRCGHITEYTSNSGFDAKTCEHIPEQKGKLFLDSQGIRRICAEILGTTEPGSCVFREASFLTQTPAFGGAVRRNVLSIAPDQAVAISIPAFAAQRPAIQKYLGSVL